MRAIIVRTIYFVFVTAKAADKVLVMLVIYTCPRFGIDAVNPYYVPKALCDEGQYAQVFTNGSHICNRCSVCRRGEEATTPCSDRNDTVCEGCPTGTFNDEPGGKCSVCTICYPGEYRLQKCRPKTDTICQACPEMTFSAKNNSNACRYCSVCTDGEIIIRNCTSSTNRRCGNFRNFLSNTAFQDTIESTEASTSLLSSATLSVYNTQSALHSENRSVVDEDGNDKQQLTEMILFWTIVAISAVVLTTAVCVCAYRYVWKEKCAPDTPLPISTISRSAGQTRHAQIPSELQQTLDCTTDSGISSSSSLLLLDSGPSLTTITDKSRMSQGPWLKQKRSESVVNIVISDTTRLNNVVECKSTTV